jgi:hypothetical protein
MSRAAETFPRAFLDPRALLDPRAIGSSALV